MRRSIWLVLFVFSAFNLSAQRPPQKDYFNTDAFWGHLVLEDSSVAIQYQATDTVIIVASNRRLGNDCLRFASECVDEQSLHYYLVYTGAGKWHVHKLPTLKDAMSLLPDKRKDWVVYVEGMGKIFTSALDRGLQMADQYGVNVLYLDYPSYYTDANPLMNFIWVNKNAKSAWKYFIPVLEEFHDIATASFTGVHYTMLLHSMGNHFIEQAVKHHALATLNKTAWIDNLVMNAPCIPRANACHLLQQLSFARHLYVHYNSDDGVLKWARLATHRQLLGQHPTKTCPGAVYVNFNTVCGQTHSNFLNLYNHTAVRDDVKEYYSVLLHGRQVNINDTNTFRPSVYKHRGYDLLPNGQQHAAAAPVTAR